MMAAPDPKEPKVVVQSDLEKMWRLLEQSGAETMTFKLFKKSDGRKDRKPFRAIILVEGEEGVERVLSAVEAATSEEDDELEKRRDHDL